MTTFYAGIDPGTRGGLGIIDETGRCVRAISMPAEPRHLFLELCRMREPLSKMLIAIEDAPTFGGRGQKGDDEKAQQGARSAAVQQRNAGRVEGVVACTGLPFRLVAPITWKSAMHIRLSAADMKAFADINEHEMTRTERTTLLKRKSLERARGLFPDADLSLAKHEGKAEALLIAEWLRRTEQQRGFPS